MEFWMSFFWNNQDQFCSGMNEFGLVWSSGWQDFFWSIRDQVHTDCRSSVRPIFFRNVGLSASIERRSNFPTPLNKQVNIWYWCGWKWWILKYECPIHVSWHHSPFLVNWVWFMILNHPHLMYQPSYDENGMRWWDSDVFLWLMFECLAALGSSVAHVTVGAHGSTGKSQEGSKGKWKWAGSLTMMKKNNSNSNDNMMTMKNKKKIMMMKKKKEKKKRRRRRRRRKRRRRRRTWWCRSYFHELLRISLLTCRIIFLIIMNHISWFSFFEIPKTQFTWDFPWILVFSSKESRQESSLATVSAAPWGRAAPQHLCCGQGVLVEASLGRLEMLGVFLEDHPRTSTLR